MALSLGTAQPVRTIQPMDTSKSTVLTATGGGRRARKTIKLTDGMLSTVQERRTADNGLPQGNTNAGSPHHQPHGSNAALIVIPGPNRMTRPQAFDSRVADRLLKRLAFLTHLFDEIEQPRSRG
jgi:hypothetical protein